MNKIIVDVDLAGKLLVVTKVGLGPHNVPIYQVSVDGEVKHPGCTAEDVMRALGGYIHGLSHKLTK